jgi:hypothetical protein
MDELQRIVRGVAVVELVSLAVMQGVSIFILSAEDNAIHSLPETYAARSAFAGNDSA